MGRITAHRLQVISAANSVALAVIALVFSLVVALVIFPRVGNCGGSPIDYNTTNTVELGMFVSATFDPNSVSGGQSSFSKQNVNVNLLYISPTGTDSLESGVSFASLDQTTHAISLTRPGYYSGFYRMVVDSAPLVNQPGQYCNLTIFDPDARPDGFYGVVPELGCVRVAGTNMNNPQANVCNTPFSFFYNGTLPIQIPLLLSCRVYGGGTDFAQGLNIVWNFNRENMIWYVY